ncbi:MAG: right-handed parallel beta-helix repeat-containing protein [Planctomycetaceae bacterium]|nr:right-handed parallel beta-helix repeat-containing protein [Planctomycetaceae bacterium]
MWNTVIALMAVSVSPVSAAEQTVNTTETLVQAVDQATPGTTIRVAAGRYELAAPLTLTSGVTLCGSGPDTTVITHVSSWRPSTTTLPDPEMKTKGMDTTAFLICLANKAADVAIKDLTLDGPAMHGAIYGFGNSRLTIQGLRIQNTLWTGLRTFGLKDSLITDCEFVDAGGRWKKGEPGVSGGITGGAIFSVWMSDTRISHNRFRRTTTAKERAFYGIKGRQARRCRVDHNTIEANFSIEFPFENDEDNEIDHNICYGAISIPKYAGGRVPESGRTFHIHHNLMHAGYSIEFVRNGVEVDHNLFDFSVDKDGGNLISGFGKAAADGPASFHHNLVSNPGRGVIWINEVFNNLSVYNNHIITRTTATPRTEGLFGLNADIDDATLVIRDNIIECQGLTRPLLRRDVSDRATIENNRLVNVSDTARYGNPTTGAPTGLTEPLRFRCGVHGETTVDQWTVSATPADSQPERQP